jgi:DNA-binding PadR family transcriptional regulator
LLLIAEEPRNGYQLIEELAGRTGGSWRPSSGAIYPALAQLEDEGLIAPNEVDGRKVYELTDAGRDAVAAHQGPAPWDTATQDASDALGGRPGGQMWQAFGQVAMATKAVGATRDAATFAEATKVLDETRRALYRILADGPQDAPAATYDDAVDAEFVEDDLSD